MKDKLFKIFVGLNYMHWSEIEDELKERGVDMEPEEETKDIDIFSFDSETDMKMHLSEKDVKELLK